MTQNIEPVAVGKVKIEENEIRLGREPFESLRSGACFEQVVAFLSESHPQRHAQERLIVDDEYRCGRHGGSIAD